MESLALTARLAGLAVFLQSWELLLARAEYSPGGPWDWQNLRADFPAAAGWLLDRKPFINILCLNMIAGLALACGGPVLPLCAVTFSICFLTSARWRGALNGGADSMTLLILLALAVGEAFGRPRGALIYIGLQLTLSFTISGWAKARRSSWRNGQAARAFLGLKIYGAPTFANRLALSNSFCFVFGWAALLFEVAFPLALIGPRTCLMFVGLAILFNLANFWLIGLNRFVFAWAAAYPALYYCSLH